MGDEMPDAVGTAPVAPAAPAAPEEGAKIAEESAQQPCVVNVVVSSRVRKVMKGLGMRSSGQLAEAVNAKVLELLDRAVAIAKDDGRATVRPRDVLAA